MNIRCQIAYVGTHYLGWQKTQMGPSIEAALEKALEQILQEKITLQAASRTDRGVHAEGQVINFFSQKSPLDLSRLHRSVQGILPKDISMNAMERATLDFHPTLDCKAKEYEYLICNKSVQLPFHREFSWHYRYPLNLDLMQQAKSVLIGTHDFSAFSNERTNDAVRTIYSIDIKVLADEQIYISVIGNAFLYKMMRNFVGTLVYIGCGKIPLEKLPAILASRDRTQAGMTAPACGLCLKKVFYEKEVYKLIN